VTPGWPWARRHSRSEFPIESATQVAQLADTVENLDAAAYLGQAGRIESPEVLAAALQVEARHAAAIDLLLGKTPTPNGAFDLSLTKDQVLAEAGPLIKS